MKNCFIYPIFIFSATKPGLKSLPVNERKPKDSGFKTAPDGRLIICDEYDKDDVSEQNRPKKKKSKFPHSDSEDDYG